MLDSFYSGVSGMIQSQSRLDVTGNNIANASTQGYKKSRTMFKDMISQQIGAPRAPQNGRGAVNPLQTGTGVTLASTDRIHTQGAIQETGRALDLALTGAGYFIVGPLNPQGGIGLNTGQNAINNVLYTRAGNFYIDKQGYIVTSDGNYLAQAANTGITGPNGQQMVNLVPIQVPAGATQMEVNPNGAVTYKDASGQKQVAGQLVLGLPANEEGFEKAGNTYFRETPNSGGVSLAFPGQFEVGAVQSNALEMSNVDLGEEMTELIMAQRNFQASSHAVKTSDEILQEIANLRR